MVNRNLIRGLDLAEEEWQQELEEAMEGFSDESFVESTQEVVINQIVDGRIRRAIAENLQAKGLSRAEPGEADLAVTYYASLNSQMQFHTTGWGYGGGWGWGPRWGFGYGFWPGWTTTTVHTYHEGTIIIDLIDREKNQLVWRGVTTRVLGKKSHSDEKIDQSMSRVFVDFPPAT